MDLLSLFSVLARHRWIMLVTIVLTMAGEAVVMFVIPPQYEMTAQYVLINALDPPTDREIQRHPALATLNANNPYLRVPVPVVVDVLAERVSTDAVRDGLVEQGADKGYEVAATNAIGGGLVIAITGTGHSAGQSQRTIDIVSRRMLTELHDMQKVNGADDRYLLQALPVGAPNTPTRRFTRTARSMIAVAVAGLVLLFALISIAEAVQERRRSRALEPARRLHIPVQVGKDGETFPATQVGGPQHMGQKAFQGSAPVENPVSRPSERQPGSRPGGR